MTNMHQLGLSLSIIGICCQAATATGSFMNTPIDIKILPFHSSKKTQLDEVLELKLNRFIYHSGEPVLSYPIREGATAANYSGNLFFTGDEDEEDGGGDGSQSLIAQMSQSMMNSMVANPVGADLDEEIQNAIRFSATAPLHIAPLRYPNLYRLVELGGRPAQISGQLSPELMLDMDKLIEKTLKKEETTIEKLEISHKLLRWLRWLRASNIIHTLNRIYLKRAETKQADTEQSEPEDLNFTMLMITYSDLDSMIRFYRTLTNINMGDIAFSDVVRNFLSQMLGVGMPSEESGIIPTMEQPVTILVTAIVYQSSLIQNLIIKRHINFDLSAFQSNRILYEKNYQYLIPSLAKAISNLLITDEKDGTREVPKSQRCALAIIHILLNESSLMSQLFYGQPNPETGGSVRVTTISPNLLSALNEFAEHSPQAAAQSTAVIIAMLNMPYLTGILNRIETSSPQNLHRVFIWISERYTTIVNNTQDEQSQLILEAAIESIAHPSEVSANNTGSINDLVSEWVSTIQTETLPDADGFEVAELDEYSVRVVTADVVSALIRLNPSISQFSNKNTSDIKKEMRRLWEEGGKERK